jgi:hypothetical protein
MGREGVSMNGTRPLLLFAALCWATAAGAGGGRTEAVPAAEVIPPESAQIHREGELGIYPGDLLYEYINGGAPLYLEYGFVEVASQELLYNERTYILDVYQMEDPLAAFGIFSVRRPSRPAALDGFPFSSADGYQCLVAYGTYLFEIAAYESDEHTPTEMAYLAQLAASRTKGASPEIQLLKGAPFNHLPVQGRLPGMERLARGPVSLRSALGPAAAGTFYRTIEAVQISLAQHAVSKGEASGKAPWWIVAGYHPREDESGLAHPATTLVVLVHDMDPLAIVRAAGMVAVSGPHVEVLEGGRGWLWGSPEEGSGCAVRYGFDLVLATSQLDEDVFRTWALRLAQR